MDTFKGILKIVGIASLILIVFFAFYDLGVITVLTGTIQWFIFVLWLYWFIISLFGFGKPSKVKEKFPQKKFLILIPAHNEEKVIGNIVENLHNLDYPKSLYEILVIADNCTDGTAVIARRMGARVLEHTSLPDEPRGKPHAIKFALNCFNEDLYNYDAFVIFDADNLVSLNYLRQMNNHLLKGERLIQCYLDTKNPDDNWITLGYGSSYYYMNRSWQLSKYRIGLGNAIGGTGFCVDTSLMREVGWTATSLTEDLEFTMQCLLKGVKASWSHHARVYDEKPTGFKASCVQRLRWARGHWDVAGRYIIPLIKRFALKGDILALDGVFYLINPGKIVLGALTSTMFYFSYFSHLSIFKPILPAWVWIILLLFNFSYIAIATLADSGKKLNLVKAVICLVLNNLTYIPLFVWSMVTSSNQIWVRTDHSRTLSQEEIAELGLHQVSATREV